MNIPQGDFGYALTFRILNPAGSAFDLSGYTITFRMWKPGSAGYITEGVCSSASPTTGVCTYTIAEGDFTTAGQYKGEVELTKVGARESTTAFDIDVEDSR